MEASSLLMNMMTHKMKALKGTKSLNVKLKTALPGGFKLQCPTLTRKFD